jgi:hypothetical protein
MSADPVRVPSAEQLDSVLKSLQVFNNGLSYTWTHTRKQEEDVLPRFEAIADALTVIQPALDAVDGSGPDWWEHEAAPVLRDVLKWLEALAADWGWEPYLTASLRQATKEERQARFREEYERPIDEAAIVWFRNDRSSCPGEVWESARRGRQAGYTPEISLEEARRRFAPNSAWLRRAAEAPCYGKTYPRLGEDGGKRLWRLLYELTAALGRMPRESAQTPSGVLPVTQGVAQIQVPDDDAGLSRLLRTLDAEIRRSTLIEADPRLKIELSQNPSATSYYDLDALRQARKQVVDRIEAAKNKHGSHDAAEPVAPQVESQGGLSAVVADLTDENAIADRLLEKGYSIEAAFVRHFKGLQSCTCQEIIEAVCPSEEREWATVKTWTNRVKNALAEVVPRCRLSFSTSQREMRVVKKLLPE